MGTEEHRWVLRRQILRALAEANPAPLTPLELREAMPLGERPGLAEELHEETVRLQTWGFLVNLRGDALRTPWYRLSPEGLAQIEREAERLDPRIWGRLAVG